MNLALKDMDSDAKTGDTAPVELPLDLSVKIKATEPKVVAKRSDAEPEVRKITKRARTSSSSSSSSLPGVPLALVDNNALRASVVVMSPRPVPSAPKLADHPSPPVPHIAASLSPESPILGHASPTSAGYLAGSSPLNHFSVAGLADAAAVPAPAAYCPHNVFSADYNQFYAAAVAAVAAAVPAAATAPAVQFNMSSLQQCEQQQIQLQQLQQLQQQQQLQQRQQLQMQLQQQLDFNTLMRSQTTITSSPLYVATSTSSPPLSSNESNPFMFGRAYDSLPRTPFNFGYPYFSGLLGVGFGGDSGSGVLSGGSSGGGGGDSGGDQSDGDQSPVSTTAATTAADHNRGNRTIHRDPHFRHRDVYRRLHASIMTMHRASDAADSTDLEDADADEIAAIYRQSDFLSFRQRYIDSLGPPRNFEKMRRSVPNKKIGNGGGQQSYDQTYVVKRQKNNEAAKKSRDAKRQKYIENQISVLYLTKKVSEMKEIKRRLLMTM